jgi:hypothetical protein
MGGFAGSITGNYLLYQSTQGWPEVVRIAQEEERCRLDPQRLADEYRIEELQGAAALLGGVLKKVQLLVLGGCPEILAHVLRIFLLQVTDLINNGDAAFLAEGWIGHDDAEPLTWVTGEAVYAGPDRARIGIDTVQIEVHDA